MWTRLNVIVFAAPATCVAASKLPSEAGSGARLLVASIVTMPPAVMSAPPVTDVATVGSMLALEPKKLRFSAPPVVLLVLASASLRLSALAVTSEEAMMTDDAPPSVVDTLGVPSAVESELEIERTPPPALSMMATARSLALASTSTVSAPAVSGEPGVRTCPSSFAWVEPEASAVGLFEIERLMIPALTLSMLARATLPETAHTSTALAGAASVPVDSTRASVVAFAVASRSELESARPSAAVTTVVTARTSSAVKSVPSKLWKACNLTRPPVERKLPAATALVVVSSVAVTVSKPPATPSASWMPR